MSNLYTALAIIGITLLPACASIGAVIDGTQEFTTGVIDSSVKSVATGAEIADSTIKAVSDEVDRQTDELQEPKKD